MLIPRNLFNRGRPPVIKPSKLRPREDIKKAKQYQANLSTIEQEEDPVDYEEAMSRRDRDKWKEAMDEEIKSMMKNEVWNLVQRPKTNVVTCKWLFRTKRKPNGEIDRYKARLVARGFSQINGIDYTETYAPVVDGTTVRLLFAYAAVEKLLVAQFDVKTAFLYGSLEEIIYIEQPRGYEKGHNNVCLLKKSLYGLKQAPRCWNIRFTEALKRLNLEESQFDHCIYYKLDPLLIIAIYVDDGLILSRDQREITKTLSLLQKEFDMHVEDNSTYLGFQIHRGVRGEISLYQESYIGKCLKKFPVENTKSVDIPISTASEDLESEPLDPNAPYREAVGTLMYAAINTRIDIAYAVGIVSRKVLEIIAATQWTMRMREHSRPSEQDRQESCLAIVCWEIT